MNIVFFGTSEFAIPALRSLLDSRHKVLALVTQPDKKKGRSLRLSPPPTKVLARTKGVPVFQPCDASGDDLAAYLGKLSAELFIVVAFGQILKKRILDIPGLYSLNLHGSLLPKYRGGAPTNWAIINGDRTSGVTIIRMDEGMDEGDMIAKREITLDAEETNITLSEKLSVLGAKLLLETIDSIDAGKSSSFAKQDDSAATYAPKLKKEDGLICWGEPAPRLHNKVRGLIPWPGAYTFYEGKMLKILKTDISISLSGTGDKAQPGEVVDIIKGEGIMVHTASGDLAIKYLQLEGRKILDSDSFVRGHRIPVGYIFGR